MLIIFDWDGTIVDSRAISSKPCKWPLHELNWPSRSDDQCAQMIGLGLTQTALSLYPGILLAEIVIGLQKSYSAFFVELKSKVGGTAYFPTVLDTLKVLTDAGYQLAIATGKSRRGLNQALEQDDLYKYFMITKTADEVFFKTKPCHAH